MRSWSHGRCCGSSTASPPPPPPLCKWIASVTTFDRVQIKRVVGGGDLDHQIAQGSEPAWLPAAILTAIEADAVSLAGQIMLSIWSR